MEPVDSDIAKFIIRRGQIKAQLTKFQTFLNDGVSDKITQLKLRMEKIRTIWDEFDNIQNNIEEKVNDPKHVEYRDEFVDLYFNVMAQAEDQITQARSKETEHVQCTSLNSSYKNDRFPLVKLKHLEVPTFTGKYED